MFKAKIQPQESSENLTKSKLSVDMHCATCAVSITKKLTKKGVKTIANAALQIVKVEYDPNKITVKEIEQEINKLGYKAKEIQ